MTDTQNEPVEVTQADRDAANVAFDIAFRGDTDGIDLAMAEIFARHRINPLPASTEPADSLIEKATKAILFEDSGSTEGWEDNVNLGKAAVEAILPALTRTDAPKQRPWCETCGKDVHEVLCPTCAKWWNDNPPPSDALAEARDALEAPWSWACPETGTGHDNRGQEDCPDCGFPVCIEPDWQNAETCIENVLLSYTSESVCDEDGPVDTVVSSGDLYVLLSLAGAAYHARAALSRPNAGEVK